MEEMWREYGGGCAELMRGGNPEDGWREMMVERWEVVERDWVAGVYGHETQNRTCDSFSQWLY